MAKEKIKNPVILLLLAGMVVIISMGVLGCTAVDSSSRALEDYPGVVQELVQEFGLEPDKVMEVLEQSRENAAEGMKKRFEERREEAGEAAGERFEEMLERALEEGDITPGQKEEILAKKDEFRQKTEEFKDLPPEERREAARELHDSTIEWAEENDLDLRFLMRPKQSGSGKPKFRRHGEDQGGSFQDGMAGQHFKERSFDI